LTPLLLKINVNSPQGVAAWRAWLKKVVKQLKQNMKKNKRQEETMRPMAVTVPQHKPK
jgi:hypothetical protein